MEKLRSSEKKMTDLKQKKMRISLFQNFKVAENAIKMTMKSLTEKNVSEDILEIVLELKGKVGDLVDIVESQIRIDNEETDNRIREKEIDKIPIRNHQHLIKCNLCSEKFELISYLEKHIKKEHIEFKPYKFDHCRKEFITKWRLEKHLRMHSTIKVKTCKYFKKKDILPL